MNSKLYVIFTFIITVYIMFFQNLSYTINLIEIIPWAWLRRFIDNYATIGVFLICRHSDSLFYNHKEFLLEK